MDYNSIISQGFEYCISVFGISSIPKTKDLPHVAFFGSSNVGKSSLISNLCKTKRLSFSSKTPGKTTEILLFTPKHPFFHKKAFFVDFPGYGYAKVQNSTLAQWEFIPQFILETNIVQSFILIPFQKPIMQNDIDLVSILNHKQFAIIITKCEKLSQEKLDEKKQEVEAVFSRFPNFTRQVFCTSVKTKNLDNEKISKEIFDIFKIHLNNK
jgi:GTP-binding protein